MLVQFKFKNFLSFKEEVIFDMTAISAYKEHEYNLTDIGIGEKFLKVASVYGANASGKSNLCVALNCFQDIIKESLNNTSDRERTILSKCYNPFRFDGDKNNIEFQVVIISDGFEYTYGFEYNDVKIIEEWLYRRNLETNRMSIILERDEDNVNLGASVRRECTKFKDQVSSDVLVLSFFNKLKLKAKDFSNVYRSIVSNILVAYSDFGEDVGVLEDFLPAVIDDEEEKSNLLEFLSAIDTGISDVIYKVIDDKIRFYTIHVDSDGNQYPLYLFDESSGTIKGIEVFIFIKAAVYNDGVLVVDELNTKLHPLLLKFLIDLFYDNKSRAQLIYTTHDTTLLDKKFFRRDQVWFVQKDSVGRSELTSLAEFKVRTDASFEKDYLAGVYGGIPLIKDFELRG